MVREKSKIKYIVSELVNHIPFSIMGVIFSLIMMGVLTFIAIVSGGESLMKEASNELFHVFHPVHVFLSAAATTAMYWKHERSLFKAIIIGLLGSIAICGLSDAVFPFLGGLILGVDMHMHICLVEHYQLVLLFATIGIFVGLVIADNIDHSTEYSHSIHVFVSSSASILYLIGFGVDEWIHALGGVLVLTIFSVTIPCCLSDIVFPLTCAHKHCRCRDNC